MRGDEHQPQQDEDEGTRLGEGEEAEELSGKLASNPDEERLMRSVLENDTQDVDDGKLVAEAVNQGIGSFTPDMMFSSLVQNFRQAEKLFGETIVRALSGYSPDYVKKNISIPEFRDTLQQNIKENIEELQERGTLDSQGFVTRRGMKLASLVLYTEELDHLVAKGLGKEKIREKDIYGEKDGVVKYRKQRFRDIAFKQSVKLAARRGRDKIEFSDLRAYERSNTGKIQIIYAMDSSGSMRGEKISKSKKAGIALAYRAIEQKNDVGLVVFSSKIEKVIPPTQDFSVLLDELTKIRAGKETNISIVIKEAMSLFSRKDCTKHLLILTDAVPTKGNNPRNETLQAASAARDANITISIVGISLDKEGTNLAREVTEIGGGRLYRVEASDELDLVMLEEYEHLSA